MKNNGFKFISGMVALFYGYEYNYYFKQTDSTENIKLCMQASVIITIILTLIGALKAFKNQAYTAFGL